MKTDVPSIFYIFKKADIGCFTIFCLYFVCIGDTTQNYIIHIALFKITCLGHHNHINRLYDDFQLITGIDITYGRNYDNRAIFNNVAL